MSSRLDLEVEAPATDENLSESLENEGRSMDPAFKRDGSDALQDFASLPGDFNDIFSVTIREGTRGIALYSVLVIASCMAMVSGLMLLEYRPPSFETSATTTLNSTTTKTTESDAFTSPLPKPLWADLLFLQIQVIQNLVHASLLGGAAIVAACRGDAWFMFFSRNCAFFFGLPAISYLTTALFETDSRAGNQQIIICSLFAVFCSIAFFRLEAVSWKIRNIPHGHISQSCLSEKADTPQGVARNQFEVRQAKIVHQSAIAVQLISVLYTVVTTALELSSRVGIGDAASRGDNRHLDGVDTNNRSALFIFEASYSLGAHEAFLLTLFLLCSVYPSCPACYGGAILASAWRFLLALCSGIHLLTTYTEWTSRATLSLLFTSLEGASVFPILFSASLLARNDMTGGASSERLKPGNKAGYSQVEIVDNSVMHGDQNEFVSVSDRVMGFTSCSLRNASCGQMSCPTLGVIGESPRYSARKRLGATILWKSSLCLFVGMSLECVALLTTTKLGSGEAHDVYKWGMHVCAMVLFCCVMNVSSPGVYSYSRILLFVACPAGSVIGIWQLWLLFSSSGQHGTMPILVASLFGIRVLTGFVQTIGLCLLSDTKEDTEELPERNEGGAFIGSTETSSKIDDSGLQHAVRLGRALLLKIYIPTVALYVATSTLLGNIREPMISPSTFNPSAHATNTFAFAPIWPGIGLSFHFGLLLVVFASDGLTAATPSYPPSLTIASLFSGHVALLLTSHLIIDMANAYMDIRDIESSDWLRWTAIAPWVVSASWLSFILIRIRRLKTKHLD